MLFLTSILAAASATLATAAYSTSCSSGPAAKFLMLSNYEPAQQFCSQNYPPPAPKTVTLCSAAPSYTGSQKRDDDLTADSGSGMPLPQRTIFKALLRQGESTQKTFCFCITPPVKPITVVASCAEGQSCGTDGVCRPTRDCSNPSSCDGHSFCGKGPSGNNLFCHQDTDNAEKGYCMNDGPPGQGCPEPYEDCESNADCGGSRVCIHSCCRSEPFCVDVMDYKSDNVMSPSRMLKRSAGLLNPI